MMRTLLRRTALAGAATTALLVAGACADDRGSTGPDRSGAATAPAGAVFNDADVVFAQNMIVHHHQAVDMADLATTRAGSVQVKALANKIKARQGTEVAAMARWLVQWGQPTAAPGSDGDAGQDHGHDHDSDSSMPGMSSEKEMKSLAGTTGAAFDKRLLTMMIAHHEGAITLANQEATAGSHPEATALAGKLVVDQQAEISEMKKLLSGV